MHPGVIVTGEAVSYVAAAAGRPLTRYSHPARLAENRDPPVPVAPLPSAALRPRRARRRALAPMLAALLALLVLPLAACSDVGDDGDAAGAGGDTADTGGNVAAGDTCAHLPPEFSIPGSDVGERYACISLPEPDATVEGRFDAGGYTAGAFEQALVIELRDAAGTVLVATPVTASAPDLGLVGPWNTTLTVPAGTASGAGTLVAYATSARDGSVDFEASIPVRISADAP